MLYLLGFDKVETIRRRLISTTSLKPHIRFYNYYLMGWNIKRLLPMIVDEQNGLFTFDNSKIWIEDPEDKRAEQEIKEIKSKVLLQDRHLYLKNK